MELRREEVKEGRKDGGEEETWKGRGGDEKRK